MKFKKLLLPQKKKRTEKQIKTKLTLGILHILIITVWANSSV